MDGLEDLRHPDRGPSLVAVFVYLMIGPTLWGAHLTLVYGAHTLICALGGSASLSALFIAVATILAAAPLLVVLLMQRRFGRLLGLADTHAGRGTYDAISGTASVLSLAGIVWAGATVGIISSCVQGR